MAIDTYEPTWEEALKDYLTHARASRAHKTCLFYRCQLSQLVRWAGREEVPFEKFGKRHLDRYLAERRETVGRSTLRHDAVAAKAFFKWCAKNDLLLRSPLAEYEIHAAPKPAKYVPTDEELQRLLKALGEYWDPQKNPGMKHIPHARRLVHRERNRAILLLLIDTACRIGEALHLEEGDFRAGALQVLIRESKGKEPRALPLSPATAAAVNDWLRVRARMMRGAEEDPGFLFLSEYGTRMDESRFGKAMKAVASWAGLPGEITLHSVRHYSLTKLAKHNLLMAQAIAGHKDPRTTNIYAHADADFLRQVHGEVGAVDTVLSNRRAARKKRLV
jgi:Site-specific recombinase XerD